MTGEILPPSSFGIPDYDEAAMRATVYDHEMRITTMEQHVARMVKRDLE